MNSFNASAYSSQIEKYFKLDSGNVDFIENSNSIKMLFINASLKDTDGKSRVSLGEELIIAPIFNQNDEVIGVNSISGNSITDVDDENYSGKVNFQFFNPEIDEIFTMNLTFEQGSLINSTNDFDLTSSRVSKCNDFYDVLDCAGGKFADAECCFEEGACYFAFIPCLAYRVMDCYIQDCKR